MSELKSWAYISVVGVIWFALAFVAGVTGNFGQFSVIADVVPLLLVLAGVFEHWGWRWRRLHPHIVPTPVIRGTWKGQLESLWEDPVTKARPPVKTVYLSVEQTLTTSFTRLMSDESSSDQVAGTMASRPSGRRFLAVIYQNTPPIDLRASSPIHFGGLALDIYGAHPTRLEGEYWTDRQSKGKLTFSQRTGKIVESFAEAEALAWVADTG